MENDSNKKAVVTQRVIEAVEKIAEDSGKKLYEVCDIIGLDYSNLAKFRDSKSGRQIGTNVIYEAVNVLGLNPKRIFLEQGPITENLFMENSIKFDGEIGDGNTITNEHNTVKPVITGNHIIGNVTVVHSLENLINDLSPELRHKIQEHFIVMSGEIETLKKMIDEHKIQLVEKNREISDYKNELIETRRELRENSEKLIKALEQLSDAKDKYSSIVEQYSQGKNSDKM